MKTEGIVDISELTPLQQGLLFHTLCAPDSGVYVTHLRGRLRGEIDPDAFARAWRATADRHAALRTSFFWQDLEKPVQVVHGEVDLPLEQLDWRRMSPEQQQRQLQLWLRLDRRKGFRLEEAPLMRLALIRLSEEDYWFIWSNHHILLDGWSLPLVLKDVFAHYEAFRLGKPIAMPPVSPFQDYIAWLQEQDLQAAETFWRHRLAGFYAPTQLRIDRTGNETSRSAMEFDETQVRLSAALTGALETLAREHQLTLSTLVQAAWSLVLGRYSGDRDVVFGVTCSGRLAPIRDIESIVGLFINTLPARVNLPPDEALLSWLKSLQAEMAELRTYEYSPLEEVQGYSSVPRGTSLFESLYVFENYPLDTSLTKSCGEKLEILEIHDDEQTSFPLNLIACPGPRMLLRLIYDRQRFEKDAMERMGGHLETVLQEFVDNPHRRLADISCLSKVERQQMLVDWNATDTDYALDQCIHEWFEAQVDRSPDAVALRYDDQELTYRELDRRANQLARHLVELGVGPEVIVALCTERSFELIVGMLGVLKAGGAYVPMDPDHPSDRLTFMLEDCGARVLVMQQRLLDRLPSGAASVVCIDSDWPRIAELSPERLPGRATPTNLAYVIYTSGSTGRPKGVAVEHRGLCNVCHFWHDRFGMCEQTRMLQFASNGVDAAVVEIFPPLAYGGSVCLARREDLLPGPALIEVLQRQRVTMIILPPSALAVLPDADLPDLRTVLSAGEACSAEIVRRWSGGHSVVNGYGPTENTVCTTTADCRPDEGQPSIGWPMANVQVYVLNDDRQPVPIQVPGELYIGGTSLAREYLHRPELTAERFVPNPFDERPGSRLYRSGDLVRWRPDGNLEFLGRVDHQVKIRGFRIELGEIEAVLSEHPAVCDNVVLARHDDIGDARLVAYIVAYDGQPPTVPSLRSHLEAKLPKHMVPSAFVFLDAFPVAPSGKVDRKALPDPDRARPELETTYVAPRTPVEQSLAEIWSQVLGVEQVGIHDDFFELGGASIKSLRVVSKAAEAGLALANGSLTPELLFEHTTIAKLAPLLHTAEPATGADAANEPGP